jgi:hypothetical protein
MRSADAPDEDALAARDEDALRAPDPPPNYSRLYALPP